MTQKELREIYYKLVTSLGDNPTKVQINKALKVFMNSFKELTDREKALYASKAIKMLKEEGKISDKKAVELASSWSIITARTNKDGELLNAVYDIQEAIDNIPLNMTKKAREKVLAWKDRTSNYSLMSEFGRAKDIRTAVKNIKFLGETYIEQKRKDLKFYLLPEDTPIVYITVDDDRRDDVCGMLHGTTWSDKTKVPKIAQPLIHPNCRCTLVPIEGTTTEKVRVKESEAPKWVLDMIRPISVAKRLYGQGYSNFKRVTIDGVKYIEYLKVLEK